MKIWVTRHGQTRYNLKKLMQGRTDEPLNETGIRQAEMMRAKIGDVHFDAVYASPLDRAIVTGAIIAGTDRAQVQIDERIIETDFGRYELRPYLRLGLAMTAFWLWPEVIPAPRTVEPIAAMKERVNSFLTDLQKESYENVLIACHGGIMRVVSGSLAGRKSGLIWRPKPRNCEVRIFETDRREMIDDIKL